jgi:deoxycytidylate deaminase
MNERLSDGIEALYRTWNRGIVLGLTGRTGSGCTTVASILAKPKEEIDFPEVRGVLGIVERKERMIRRFFQGNWTPFTRITVAPIIASYLMEASGERIRTEFLAKIKPLDEPTRQLIGQAIDALRASHSAAIQMLSERHRTPTESQQEEIRAYVLEALPKFIDEIKPRLSKNYFRVFQDVGDRCRRYGKLFDGEPNVNHLFSLAERLGHVIDVLSLAHDRAGKQRYFVVDALRNPFEAQWLKNNVQGFYLVGVNTPETDRHLRLAQLNLDRNTIAELDEREYPQKRKKVPSGFDAWISQDIQSCLEKCDIHLSNPGTSQPGDVADLTELSKQIVRYVSLILHPGLVSPTRDERCMQAAFVARNNSGCISRQVGAVVTTENGSIVSVGWNDVPFGHVPCLLRSRDDLLTKQDKAAFSDYENNDSAFHGHLKRHVAIKADVRLLLKGRSTPFCFRDAYNAHKEENNQVHTRSLHAEENAFLQLSLNGTRMPHNAVLYSTASPCELCSKKAFQLGVRRIVYIDPYPGISVDHILGAGDLTRRPSVQLFSGAIGAAYHRLYQPMLSFKDELLALTRSVDEGALKSEKQIDLDLQKGRG